MKACRQLLPGPVIVAMILLAAPPARSGAVLKDIDFAITNDVGIGSEVCVTGSHPLLGGQDPLKAIKLTWNAGNIWRGTIALPAGETITYRYAKRNFAAGAWSNSATDVALSQVMTAQVPAHAASPWTGKTVLLRSDWSQANLLYRDVTRGGNWTPVPMQPVGDRLFRVDGVADGGSELEFVFNDGTTWLNAPAPPAGIAQGSAPAVPYPYQGLSAPYNFRTRLDVFLVQQQQVFNYLAPTGTLSAPRLETRTINSTVSGIPGRTIGIYLPRGYDQNTWKRYPVVYFHDGQNVFFPGGTFGTWDADRIATYEISQGRMRESILVAINNDGMNRLVEYLPDGETLLYSGATYTGAASKYLQFILDNVTPTLDFHYRTLGDSGNTLTAGSSMGGLISDYLVHQRSDRFSAAGIFSPAYWAAPVYLGNRALTRLSVRRYLYMGTAESSTGESSSDIYWQGALNVWNNYLRAGHPVHRELYFEGGAAALHNEPAWSRRLPSFFAYALDPWREANHLALKYFPPVLDAAPEEGNARMRWITPFGVTPELQEASMMWPAWYNATTHPVPATAEFWSEHLTNIATPASISYWRLVMRMP